MIKNVLIIPYSRNNGSEVNNDVQKLWPVKKKAIKIFSKFEVSHYKFKVVTTRKSNELYITVNNFERIHLNLIDEEEGLFFYQSDELKARSFLGFNLGLLKLSLTFANEKYSLTTLNNKQELLKNEEIRYIYESVASSDFFSFYVSNYFRANAESQLVELDNNNQHFWVKVAIANELLKEVDKFFKSELNFTSRVHSSSEVKKYSRDSVIEDRDIHWLMENPNEIFISEHGEIRHLGLNYGIDFISQSIICTDYDTYENRLIISCLYSIQTSLEELSKDFLEVKTFPHKSISHILNNTNNLLSNIHSTLNLLPPFNTRPEFSNKYLDDVRHVRLFELITKWFSFNDLIYGSESRSSILGITEIFEHYCFIKIIESLEIKNFVVDEVSFKDLNTAGTVIMKRSDETISIYYEPIVSVNKFSPLKCSKKESYYHPDIVLIYNNQENMKCGVIDPKFSNQGFINKVLAPEIFYKYGLFFHRPDGLPIDFVYAMYPDRNAVFETNDFRNEEISSQVKPSLGSFSIPFHAESAELLSGFLNKLITI